MKSEKSKFRLNGIQLTPEQQQRMKMRENQALRQPASSIAEELLSARREENRRRTSEALRFRMAK